MQYRCQLIASLLTSGLLAACSIGEPTEYHSPKETPEGPGLFSGQDGGLLSVSRDDLSLPWSGSEEAAQADELTGAETAPVTAETEEFEEFQRFREYQRWKEEAKETGEYEEFRSWLRWQQYRQWQEEQR